MVFYRDTEGRRKREEVEDKESAEKTVPPIEEQARSFTLRLAMAALKRLDELSRSEDEKVAFTAIQEILNRAFGKVGTQSPRPDRPPEKVSATAPVIQVINYADWLDQQMEDEHA